MSEQKTLSMLFQTEEGKVAKMALAHPKQSLDAGTVRAAMQKVVDSEAIESKQGKLEKPISALYLVRSTEEIFNDAE